MSIDREKIAKILTERGAVKPCHRCGQTNFSVIDGYTNLTLQDKFEAALFVGGPSVPVALVACNNCGSVTPHALGPLGLLPSVPTQASR
jgi:hypothetical protein